jgi:hypothetical protein
MEFAPTENYSCRGEPCVRPQSEDQFEPSLSLNLTLRLPCERTKLTTPISESTGMILEQATRNCLYGFTPFERGVQHHQWLN